MSRFPVRPNLPEYRRQREALLERVVALLRQDSRVSAAWLHGSLGRGDEDDLSDVDLFAVVEDASLDEVLTHRRGIAARVGEPVLFAEAPQNRPPGGAYLAVAYAGPQVPHLVDWSWQPRSLAVVPDGVRLLFEREPLPRSGAPRFEYQPVPEETPGEHATRACAFFWQMLLVTAKYVARNPCEERMGLAEYARTALREVREFAGIDPAASEDEGAAHPDPREKLRILRALASEMRALMPEVARRGAEVPPEIGPQAALYLDLVESTLR